MALPRILVVEDEPALLEILTWNLRHEGYEVITASDGQHGLMKARTSLPDLIVLDLMLPLVDGLTICRQLRSEPRTRDVRILMLTAKTGEVDEVVGFHMGADDYVTKPFRVKPLMSRIKSLLERRRPGDEATRDTVAVHGIEIDASQHTVRIDGRLVDLTPTEFKLLHAMARQPGRAFSRLDLLDLCRGEDANALERTIDVHIRALRVKLGDRADVITTVRGIGYRLLLERPHPDA